MIQNEKTMKQKNYSIKLKHLFYKAKITLDIVIQKKEQIIAEKKFQQRQLRNAQYSLDQGLEDEILVDFANQRKIVLLSGNIEKENIVNVQNLLEFLTEQLQSSQLFSQEMKDLNLILHDINQIKKAGEKIKSKPIQLAKKENVQPFHYLQNSQSLAKQDPVKSSAQNYSFETECKDLFQKLEKENKLVNPLKLVINQKIESSNPEVLFYVLNDQMRQSGRAFNKSLIPDERLLYSFNGQFATNSRDSQAYTLSLQETPSLTYKAIASDEKVRLEFLNKFRTGLSIDLKVSESQIQIIALEEGSIRVVFDILEVAGDISESKNLRELQKHFPGAFPQLKLKSFFKHAALSLHDFDPNFNMSWEYDVFGNYENRGPQTQPQPYFFPIGWLGYALKVRGRYDNGNDNWLMMDGNKEEWYVMFHGTDFSDVKGIMKDGRKIQSKLGGLVAYSGRNCLITKKKIGKGVYFSNHIEVCERFYSYTTKIGIKQFKVAFQSRVRPEALRQCEKPSDIQDLINEYKRNNNDYNGSLDNMDLWNNDYFVVNDTKDIRPYRILLKELRN